MRPDSLNSGFGLFIILRRINMKDRKLEQISRRQKRDFWGIKKVGVAIRTSSSMAYGWVHKNFKTEVDQAWNVEE